MTIKSQKDIYSDYIVLFALVLLHDFLALTKLIVEPAISRDAGYYICLSKDIYSSVITYEDVITQFNTTSIYLYLINLFHAFGYTFLQAGVSISMIASSLIIIVSFYFSLRILKTRSVALIFTTIIEYIQNLNI